MKYKIFTTGGTIDKVYFDEKSTFEVGHSNIDTILKQALVTVEYSVTSLCQKDSLEITDADREMIVQNIEAETADYILITHGTDTMVQTAKKIQASGNLGKKVIILTGSMQPALFQLSDAIFNIGFALGALATKTAGVYVAMNGLVFDCDKVVKNLDKRLFEAI